MKKFIIILLLSITAMSCNKVACDSSRVKKAALRMFETEVKVQLAYNKYYTKVISPFENTAQGQLLLTLSLMGNEPINIEEEKADAIIAFRQLSKGETIEDVEKYQSYFHYADSIMNRGEINLEIIMTTATNPELEKCECEASLVFDPDIDIESIDVAYDVQKASDGEIYVTIYF